VAAGASSIGEESGVHADHQDAELESRTISKWYQRSLLTPNLTVPRDSHESLGAPRMTRDAPGTDAPPLEPDAQSSFLILMWL
jgi:hypothetical protein